MLLPLARTVTPHCNGTHAVGIDAAGMKNFNPRPQCDNPAKARAGFSGALAASVLAAFPNPDRKGSPLKRALLLALLLLSGFAHADAKSEKTALIAKILKIQQPAIEGLARTIVEQPAIQMSQQASAALQSRVAADQREAVAKKIQAEFKKYVDEATPIVRERAIKLGPTTIGKLLDEKFNEKELKELLAIFESPVNRKFLELAPTMQRGLAEVLVKETQPQIEPKVRALEERVAGHLGLQRPATPAATAPAIPAAPAGK
jgi:hypothetical protein